MYEIGRLAVKIAGRDSGKKCVIVDILNDRYVMIDGETRRRKCNIIHIEPLDQTIKINKNASHDEIKEAFKDLGLEVRDTKPREKQVRPIKLRSKEKVKVEKVEKKKGIFGRSKKEKVVEAQVAEAAKPTKEMEKSSLEELAGIEDKDADKKTSDKKEKKPKKAVEKSHEKKPAVKKKKDAK